VQLRFAVVLLPRRAALDARGLVLGVDLHAFHQRQIDQQSAVDGAAAGDVVAAALDRDLETALASERHGVDDVGGVAGLCDQRRTFVDESVMDTPGPVKPGVVGLQ
jgi:hypothetical protein